MSTVSTVAAPRKAQRCSRSRAESQPMVAPAAKPPADATQHTYGPTGAAKTRGDRYRVRATATTNGDYLPASSVLLRVQTRRPSNAIQSRRARAPSRVARWRSCSRSKTKMQSRGSPTTQSASPSIRASVHRLRLVRARNARISIDSMA